MYFIVLLSFGQFFAGFSNVQVKAYIKDDIEVRTNVTYDDYDSIPEKEIQRYAPAKTDKVKNNIKMSLILLYLPLFISMFSFKLWEWCFLD